MGLDRLLGNDHAIEGLRHALIDGESGLGRLPMHIKGVLEDKCWRVRKVEALGLRLVRFERFVDFVTTPPLEGLGTTVALLKNLLRDDPEALDLLDRALESDQRPGARSDLADNVSKVERHHGNTETYALRRLRRQRPDLHAKVLSGKMSAHAAMVEAGYRRRTITVPLDNVERLAALLREHLDAATRIRLGSLLCNP